MSYLRVRKWEDFQHYKNRRPPWIKLHVEVLDDYELQQLPPIAQLLFDRMLLLAALTDNNVPNDPVYIAGKLGLRVREVADSVETLCKSGFITLNERKRPASKAIAKRKLLPMLETETETERTSNPSAVSVRRKEQHKEFSTANLLRAAE